MRVKGRGERKGVDKERMKGVRKGIHWGGEEGERERGRKTKRRGGEEGDRS